MFEDDLNYWSVDDAMVGDRRRRARRKRQDVLRVVSNPLPQQQQLRYLELVGVLRLI